MKLERGDMFQDFPQKGVVYLATLNGVVKKDGSLVMGKGSAKELAELCSRLPDVLGRHVSMTKFNDEKKAHEYWGQIVYYDYGKETSVYVGGIQTKYHWKDPGDLDLIKKSIEKLAGIAKMERCKELRFRIPFPGIGNGGLSRKDVLPLLQCLPDNVTVFER